MGFPGDDIAMRGFSCHWGIPKKFEKKTEVDFSFDFQNPDLTSIE